MEGTHYRYRGQGEIGNPDSSMVEDVQLGVSPADGEGSVSLELRSEQFPAGQVTLTPEQVTHLAAVLDRFGDGDAGLEDGGVVHPDGCVDSDGWDDLR
jgi:hypothetical protein